SGRAFDPDLLPVEGRSSWQPERRRERVALPLLEPAVAPAAAVVEDEGVEELRAVRRRVGRPDGARLCHAPSGTPPEPGDVMFTWVATTGPDRSPMPRDWRTVFAAS